MAGTTQIRKTRCSFGHFYDAVRYPQCPHCRTMQYTPVMSDEEKREVARLASIYVHGEQQETIRPVVPERSISQRRKENYYVTGWLVCIEGPETGRCYPLYHGENGVGTDEKNAVCLDRDPSVTSPVHCVIQYTQETAVFYLIPEKDRPVYVNNVLLDSPVSIQTGDLVGIGKSLMEFVAFCVGEHKWNRQR